MEKSGESVWAFGRLAFAFAFALFSVFSSFTYER